MKRKLIIGVILVLFLFQYSLYSYNSIEISIDPINTTRIPRRKVPELKPSLKPIEIKEDLSNIANLHDFIFSDEQKQSILDNHILIFPEYVNNPVTVYNKTPVPFITSDIMLHVYHVIFSDILGQIERKIIKPLLEQVFVRLNKENNKYLSSENKEISSIAEKNAILLGVSLHLLGKKIKINESVYTKVKSELDKIKKANSTEEIDYTLFKARTGYELGREEKSFFLLESITNPDGLIKKFPNDKNLSRNQLFKTIIWLQQYGYELDDPGDVLSLILLIKIFNKNYNVKGNYNALDKLTQFLAGNNDGIQFDKLCEIVEEHCNESIDYLIKEKVPIVNIVSKEVKKLNKTQILNRYDLNGGIESSVKKYFLFQAKKNYTGVLFQKILENSNKLPSGLDYAATILDSEYARTELKKEEMDFQKETRISLENKGEFEWYKNYSTGIEYSLRALVAKPDKGYPLFTYKPLWKVKQLNTSLGAWTQLQHDLYLYQAHSAIYGDGAGGFTRFTGYVEPNPEFFSRLRHSVTVLRTILNKTGVFKILERYSKDEKETIEKDRLSDSGHFILLEGMLEKLVELSCKEIEGIPFDDSDHKFMEKISENLRILTFDYNDDPGDFEDKSLICDVATEYLSRKCLEIATGNPFIIVSIVPWGDKLYLSKGAVFSYYEFEQDISNRLTDKDWKKMVRKPEDSLFSKMGVLSKAIKEIHSPEELETYLDNENPDEVLGAIRRLIELKLYGSIDRIIDVLVKRKIFTQDNKKYTLSRSIVHLFYKNEDEKWLELIYPKILERIDLESINEKSITSYLIKIFTQKNHKNHEEILKKDKIVRDKLIKIIDDLIAYIKINPDKPGFYSLYDLKQMKNKLEK